MIDVTVIIPVYNVQEYLRRCLDSLVEQDYDKTKMEIYIIDDCSTDESAKIIKEYETKYAFITAKYLEKNSGVSYARNIGIKESKGKYIMFCDSDDYYEQNSISVLMNFIKTKGADFITANYFVDSGKKVIKVDTSKYFTKDLITKKEIVSYMTLSSWSKIIKKDLFIKNNIYYPENIKRCEEMTVIPIAAYSAENPIAIDNVLYHYCQRKTSVSNSNKNVKLEDLRYFNDTFKMFCDKINQDEYKDEIEFRAIEHLLYGKTLVMLKSHVSRREILEHISAFKDKYPNFMKNEYIKNFNKAKIVFIKILNYKLLLLAKIFAKLHEKLTG